MNYNNILSNGTRLYLENELEDLLLLSRREYYNTKKFLLDNELIKIDFENLTLSDVATTVKSMPWYDSFV